MYVCMYVCMSVMGLIEIYGFMHSLRTSLACVAHGAIEVEVEDSRIEDNARMSPDVWKTINCSTKG